MEGDDWDTSPHKAGQEILHIVDREKERLRREPHDGLYQPLAAIPQQGLWVL
jgi:signal transduction histidine kinase